METRSALHRAIEFAAFLLGAFGGFLTEIAPPQVSNVGFAVGVAQFVTAGGFLIATGRFDRDNPAANQFWLGLAILLMVAFVFTAIMYQKDLAQFTFNFPPDSEDAVKALGGADLTREANDLAVRLGWNPEDLGPSAKAELVDEFGGIGNRHYIWTAASIRSAERQLTLEYVFLVFTISLSFAAFVEVHYHSGNLRLPRPTLPKEDLPTESHPTVVSR